MASAADVLEEGLWLQDYVPTSCIIVISAIHPETGHESLFTRSDSDSGPWKHIGMLAVASNDLEAALVNQ